MKITNTSTGARGVNTETGLVMIEPGQSVDVKMTDAEKEVSRNTGWFTGLGRSDAQREADEAAEIAEAEAGAAEEEAELQRLADEEAAEAAAKKNSKGGK